MIGFDSVAGQPDGSRLGMVMCAVMITSMPEAIADWKGGRSILRQSASLRLITGRPVWLSVAASPWPGKCLAADDTVSNGLPLPWYALTSADTIWLTRSGCAPNERAAMTGFSGFELTSESGAKTWLMPMARSSWALVEASAVGLAGARVAPTAMLDGYSVAGASIRVTLPPS